MQHDEAKTVKVGDTLLVKRDNYRATSVLGILYDKKNRLFQFRCTRGEFSHKEVLVPLDVEKQARKYIKNPNTKVYIHYNNELGNQMWLYSIVVLNSGAFWLCSFDTLAEANTYIEKNNLKLANAEEVEFDKKNW